ncbi:unnamed protein product [Cuscuta europaea]|uniref:Ubiquitin-like domain-containing protein n=2 Tax=Cuscuta europaea TaxID=41803 RepID=A0A9P1ECT1_CUSEU|nr:unnamed protein product [Cuscuta europaea]
MASDQRSEGPSTGSGAYSESTVNINIKTLDSQNHSFEVDTNMQVSDLKEKVASRTGVPVTQQRLIYRGKALMDDHLLSEYNMENGDTLHLVRRQPSQSQFTPTASNAEATPGQEPTTGAPRSRIGHISHSVVLGTFNVGDQGEGFVPDLNRVIGEALSSIRLGSQTGGHHPGMQASAPIAASQGNEAQGLPRNYSSQNQPPVQAFPTQPLSEGIQIPLGAAVAVPSLNMPIPDSLHTLTEFMNRMESVLSHYASQPNQSTTESSSVALPTNSHGQSTPETLSIVLRHTEHLVGRHVTSALSHIAGRLEQAGNSTDLTIRGQLQTESVQLGLAMQHLGAQFLELGRTMLTLRMGQSPAESSVNAGPSVYISPSGPNPIMVQPFPLQTYSLFGGPASGQSNPTGGFIPFGVGSAARNVNIHIHTVGSRPTNGGGAEGDLASGTSSGDSTAPPTRSSSTGAFVSPRPSVSFSGASQHGPLESTTLPEQTTSSSVKAETREVGESQGECHQVSEEPNVSSAEGSQGGHHLPCASSAAPIGLGIGNLQPKRRTRQPISQSRSDESAASPFSQGEKSIRDGQQILQSLASLPSGQTSHPASSVIGSPSFGENYQPDISNVMSQVLQSPALNGLLGGISQQTGLGSPDAFRNMMQQLTQSPGMMNTVNQIAQQIDTQDLGSMFSGLGVGPGSGGSEVNLSNMFQQMMPLVSQALGGISTTSAAQQASRTETRQGDIRLTREGMTPTNQSFQTGVQNMVRRIEHRSPPEDIFRSIVENAVQVHYNRSSNESENLVNALCSTEGLTNEFMEVLQRDVSRRLRDEVKPPRKP